MIHHQQKVYQKSMVFLFGNTLKKTALSILLLIAASCEPSLIHDSVIFDGDSWKNTETKQLTLEISEKEKFDVWVQVYYTDRWQHDYFNLALSMRTPFGETRYLSRSIRFLEDGKAQFTKSQQGYYVAEIPYFRGLEVDEPGTFEFELLSRMPGYSVGGIHKVKVYMQKVN
ncbi:MAG: hypothetical protein R6T91_03520 [Bacteroidales bacterium]